MVFYSGSAEEWNKISINSYNSCLTTAKRVYNYDGVEREYAFITNCEQTVDTITAKYLDRLPVIEREGYHFVGWYDNAEFSGSPVSVPYYSTDKTTLYAKWLTEDEWNELHDGSSFERALIAESGKSYSVNIASGGQVVYFAFTATESKSYTIQSTGSSDTYATLYNASQSSLTTNDDSVSDKNFKITYTMTAGNTYYIAVKLYSSSSTGTFTVEFN
jgi:peptidase domain protein